MMTSIALALAFLFPPLEDGGDFPPGIVAAAGEIQITEAEFLDYLVDVYGKLDTGSELIQHMIRETAIKQEMKSRGVRVSGEDLETRCAELDAAVRQHSGGEKGLMDTIAEQGVEQEEFFEALRLSIAHEAMARSDFGLKRTEAVGVEKLNLWLKELLAKKKVETDNLEKSAAAVVDGEVITIRDFGKRLTGHIGREKLSGILNEMLGIRLILMKAEGLGLTVSRKDVEAEVDERERMLQSKPGFEKITYANFLQATSGQKLEDLVASDKFRAEILLKKISKALQTERDMVRFFEKNRESFEQRFGKAARIASIFLGAAAPPVSKTSRSFDDAMQELEAIKRRIEQGETVFENMARIYSEHESGKQGGDLGFIGRGDEDFGEIVEACLRAEEGALLGPFKTAKGCHLVRVLEKRGPVEYESVRKEVARDARQELYRSMLREADIRKKY